MTTRLSAILLVVLAIAPARAGEDLPSHADQPHKTVTLRSDGPLPSSLQMDKGEVLVFENYALTAITVRFIDPGDQMNKIHCGLVRSAASKSAPPWARFRFDDKKRLTATLPPGQFASVCSLAPGTYTYETVRAGGTRIGAAPTPAKSTITVQ